MEKKTLHIITCGLAISVLSTTGLVAQGLAGLGATRQPPQEGVLINKAKELGFHCLPVAGGLNCSPVAPLSPKAHTQRKMHGAIVNGTRFNAKRKATVNRPTFNAKRKATVNTTMNTSGGIRE